MAGWLMNVDIEKNLKGSRRILTAVLFSYLPGGIQKNKQRNVNQDEQCPDTDSNWEPLQHEI
jgi:hypothetical protein